MIDKIKCVIYMRFSSNNQHETSIEMQRDRIKAYAKDNGYEIVKKYVDRAETATTAMNRNEFQKMIAEAKNKSVWKAILVYDYSRYSRNNYDALFYKGILRDGGINLISVTQPFYDNSPEAIMMENMVFVYNDYFSRKLSVTTHDGMLNAATKGLHCGGIPPLGYDVVERKYVINEYEAETVRRIFEMYINNVSYTKMCEILNKDGRTTKKGNPFTKNSFDAILKQQKYIGVFIWNKSVAKNSQHKRNSHACKPFDEQVIIENCVPPIISAEVFCKAQEKKEENRSGVEGHGKHHYMLSGKKLMKCAHCGAYLVGATRTCHGKTERYYQCPNHKHGGCITKDIRAEHIERFVARIVTGNLIKKSYFDEYNRLLTLNSKERDIEVALRGIENAIANVTKAIMYQYSEALSERLTVLEEHKSAKLEELKKLEKKLKSDDDSAKEVRIEFASALMKSDSMETFMLLKAVISEIKVDNDDIQVACCF